MNAMKSPPPTDCNQCHPAPPGDFMECISMVSIKVAGVGWGGVGVGGVGG